jgi:hypothetical protein
MYFSKQVPIESKILLSFSNYEVKDLYFTGIASLKIHYLMIVSYENTKEDWRKEN